MLKITKIFFQLCLLVSLLVTLPGCNKRSKITVLSDLKGKEFAIPTEIQLQTNWYYQNF